MTKGVECYQKVTGMLHNEARRLLVQAYEQTHDAQTVAKCFQVSTSTVYRLSGQKKKTGSVERQTSQRGRKPALTEEDLQGIDQLIVAQPDITIDEIIEKLGLSVSNETVGKAVIRLSYVYKKKSFYAAERERVRCCGGERSLEWNDHAMRSGQTGISG